MKGKGIYFYDLTRNKQRPRLSTTPPKPKPPASNTNTNTNTNDPTNKINIEDIAVRQSEPDSSSNIWVITKDVTIGSDQFFGIATNETIITAYNFTNNGQFKNRGRFFSFNSFKSANINDSTFDNNGAITVNFGEMVFSNPKQVFNKLGAIVNFGNYQQSGPTIGNQVQTRNIRQLN